MAKYAGLVGYAIQKQTRPGIWTSEITEKHMRGDVIRMANSVQSGSKINDDIQLQATFSLVLNKFAFENFQHLAYITYMGVKWKLTNVDVQSPRLIVATGGVWND